MSEVSQFTIVASTVTLGAVLARGSPGVAVYKAVAAGRALHKGAQNPRKLILSHR